MSGLLRRIRGARAAAHGPVPDQGAAWQPEGGTVHVHYETGDDAGPPALPAGADLDALIGDRPTSRRRGRLRRRLRHLRSVREVLLRDLGGLVFEVHRSGATVDAGRSSVVQAKLARLEAVTTELRELERVLADHRPLVVHEPGIGGACPACGELYGSDARYCWACGTPVAPGAGRPALVGPAVAAGPLPALRAAAAPEPPPAPAPPIEPHVDGTGEEIVGEAPTVVHPPADEQPTVIERPDREHDPHLHAGDPLVRRQP